MHLPQPGRRSRWLALAYSLAVFIWLSVEDLTIWPVTLFGSIGALLIVSLTVLSKMGGRFITARHLPLLVGLLGLVVGLGSSITVTALMFFKNARHAHVFPDYPVDLMLATLVRAPVWAVAGGLLGLSLGLGWLALRREIRNDG
jgi:hypothetical protein